MLTNGANARLSLKPIMHEIDVLRIVEFQIPKMRMPGEGYTTQAMYSGAYICTHHAGP